MAYYCRKSTRLKEYDYACSNYYFITICTHHKTCLFGAPNNLNTFGAIAQNAFSYIEKRFSSVRVDQAIVMPNHVHAIVCIENGKDAVNLNTIVGLYKSGVSRKIRQLYPGITVWQRSFHDRIIRSQQEYEKIWSYVHYNDQKWEQDCFYIKME